MFKEINSDLMCDIQEYANNLNKLTAFAKDLAKEPAQRPHNILIQRKHKASLLGLMLEDCGYSDNDVREVTGVFYDVDSDSMRVKVDFKCGDEREDASVIFKLRPQAFIEADWVIG